MTSSDAFEIEENNNEPRRARVVVLGEFSAGKSTLINLLTGASSLRTQITATQMPAVWMSYGTDAPYRVDLNGDQHPFDFADPGSIPVSETAYIRAFVEAPALELCDFIDTPGNSDPNIASEAWERVAKIADIAIWCSSSTQAWRQSELSAWREVPEHVRARSILLLTRADKLTNDGDRDKVLRRVKREAGELFSHIHMASLLNFANARDVLNDLMGLCNAVDPTSQVGSAATVAVADRLAGGTAADDAVASASKPEKEVETEAQDTAPADSPEDDYEDAFDIDLDLAALASSQEEFDDTDDVLAALTATAAVAGVSAMPQADVEPQPEPIQEPEPEPEPEAKPEAIPADPQNAQGYATELWTSMANEIPSDDPDAYAVAFDMFLERIDTEIATLKNHISMKAAG